MSLFGSAPCEAEDGSAKQPDCQFLPSRVPRGRTKKWPSMVVEMAFSESPSKVMSNARYWLYRSNGDVHMVITTKIGRSSPHIVFEAWELVNDRVQRQQVVTVSKEGNNHVYFENQPLVIAFEKHFLRPPQIPRETDIRITDATLEQLVEQVWEEQGF